MPCGMFFAQGSRMKGFDESLLELHWGSSPQMQGAQPWLQSCPHPLGTSEELGEAMNACGDLGDQGPGELCLLRNGFLGYKTITMEQRKVRQQLTGPVPISLAGRGLPSSQRNTRTWGSRGLTINLRPVMAFLVHSWHCLCLVSAYTPGTAGDESCTGGPCTCLTATLPQPGLFLSSPPFQICRPSFVLPH